MKVSIVTPSYNQAGFIERTMQSVLQQTGDFELEYIIVDGQSTDGSLALMQQYAATDQRLRYVSEPDQGQSDAINKGLRLATGEILAYINADDVYLPGALQHVVTWFRQHPNIQWAYGQCSIIDEHDQEQLRWVTAYKNWWLRRYSYRTLLVLNYISQPAVFWRRSAMQAIGYFSEQHHLIMDYEYWLRLGKQYLAGVIPHYLASFRSHASNKSSQRYREQFQQEYQVACEFSPGQRWLHAGHWLHYRLIIAAYNLIH